MDPESARVSEARTANVPWRKWGPYLSERQWGTVREDYSQNGDAWDYFSHDQARSRAYRWGEDGLAGISDDNQTLCFSLALWNGNDPILKERAFGLTNSEANHGEDVKEYYFYLDNTPSHSYMKYLYKYPQAAYPYEQLIEVNRGRNRGDMEFELLDTGIFAENRYFDVLVEYAKQDPEDILIQITATNRGPDTATIHLLPTLWFRNTWSWSKDATKPSLQQEKGRDDVQVVTISHEQLGNGYLFCDGNVPLLFTDNETNEERIFGKPNLNPYVKDGINRFIVNGEQDAVRPAQTGTKAAAHYHLNVEAGTSAVVRLRLSPHASGIIPSPFEKFDSTMQNRREEADLFYKKVIPAMASSGQAAVMRQALAGMLWSKQFFYFDLSEWLREHEANPMAGIPTEMRNSDWFHMLNQNVISMPDKWEYPWFAAWDLAFHTIALSLVDPDFAKSQLDLMLEDNYLHPSGQIPAYEWNFSDVNPPVHAWATLFLYRMGQSAGMEDIEFLKRSFAKLSLNFSWWVNRKDRFGNNLFGGGFLGLDNIGVFDRSAPLPTGGCLEQADGTAWVSLFCQNMLEISVELASHDSFFQDMATKFAEHFLWIAKALNQTGAEGMWDEEDGFYYDILRLPDGSCQRLKVHSMVGLLPLCAVTIIEPWQRERIPRVVEALRERLRRMPELLNNIHPTGLGHLGYGERGIVALVTPERLRRILTRMLDENEFLSPYGIRSLSRYHAEHPYLFDAGGREYGVWYLPAESDTGMFGGNSNWRGPIWMPVNGLLIRALLSLYLYHGDDFKIECPTGSGKLMNLYEVAHEITNRLTKIFLRDENGRRPVYGGTETFQSDPNWKDHILFFEYFHGDNGAGLGASHQTGWTGIIATLMDIFQRTTAASFLERGKSDIFTKQ
ncbi:glucosidase [Terriglobus sp. TAA 43]|uniref:MGH1-like glycoside hydrolase domain-containing protein n=1 Tax=Terriglobus sp. TAA 43 TaxID=278961 RepID=UPI001E387A44|nr:glucosidase [Terriglobus sp. TAA 43]